MAKDHVQISKTLSYWLRHKPDAAGLTLSSSGWTGVDAVLAALAAERIECDWEPLLCVVATNDKQRFELSADAAQIRARQGHSIEVDLDWPKLDPPAQLFHGTVERFMVAIEAEGLRSMSRHHVHLSGDIDTARIVGARRGKPIILVIDAAGLAASGETFMRTGNGVWLTARVPVGYFKKLS